MDKVSTIGLDIAKSVFQVHGVDAAGAVLIRKRISRAKVLEYFGELPPCLVGIEACPSAHHWGRELQGLGHTVRLIPPSYVKAYRKRSKNDANDAAAICEAVTRPSMRFVPIKTKEQQTALMLHRTRQLLVRQRTMLSNALRGHLAELGIVSAKGRNGTAELLRIITDGADSRVSPAIRGILDVLARQYGAIGTEIASIDKSIMALQRGCEASRRLEDLLIGALSCGLERIGAEAAHQRRQRQARQHHQAGQSIFAVAAGRRSNGRDPLRAQARHREAALAWPADGAPTHESGCRCARQQDCADGLGHHGSGREIQGAETFAGGISRPANKSATPIGEGTTT